MTRISAAVEIHKAMRALQSAGWSDARRARFVEEWEAMQEVGAEAVEVRIAKGNAVVLVLGEDFARHMAACGVRI